MKDFLMHYGIPGQKWGVRRYQNDDGTLTEEGKIRYGKSSRYEKYDTEDLREDRKRAYETLTKCYQKYKDKDGQIDISKEKEKYIKDAIANDSEVHRCLKRMREKQEKYNNALKTLDLNRRIETYKNLLKAQKEWKNAVVDTMLRSAYKLPKEERDKTFAYIYLHGPRLAGLTSEDYYDA